MAAIGRVQSVTRNKGERLVHLAFQPIALSEVG